jgi:hypothetical protein
MRTLPKLLKDGNALTKEPYILARVLDATVAESITVPSWARYVLLAGTVDFWADFRTTAVTPAADIENGLSPILIPGGIKELREIDGVATISIVSAYTCIATAEFYA